MVVEYIRYTLPPARVDEFEDAYQRAGRVLESDPHGMRPEVARGTAEPEHFVVRIERDSIDGDEQASDPARQFGEFVTAVKPFFDHLQERKHDRVRPPVATP